MKPLEKWEVELLLECDPRFKRRHLDFDVQLIECENRPGMWFALWVVLGRGLFFREVVCCIYRDDNGRIYRCFWLIYHHPSQPVPKVQRARFVEHDRKAYLSWYVPG
ncbi:MAG: hypothetical protein U1C49_00195 [Candidatus Andersenbacteria bacterium]|nr:hypothetical protein [Candidatus Andersenbacteria bacterium]